MEISLITTSSKSYFGQISKNARAARLPETEKERKRENRNKRQEGRAPFQASVVN
jgi:hypothetical protein